MREGEEREKERKKKKERKERIGSPPGGRDQEIGRRGADVEKIPFVDGFTGWKRPRTVDGEKRR